MYDHRQIEKKWQREWEAQRVFRVTNNPKKSPVYVLDMFPYPSADGLHVGHPAGYTASDVYARYLRMNGKEVLHPMGWDAFGLPTENAAIKKGIHPAVVTAQNISNFKRQIKSIGFSYDWEREINTTDSNYYRWTQWIFLQLYQRGLAYEKEAPIWWCPKDKTGLANEEVVNGKCDRCGTAVERRLLRQWMLKITDYAERLLAGLENLDWPEGIKSLQRNWIGRSEGAEVKFEITGPKYLFLHGYASGPDQHMFPWLKRELEKRGAKVFVPALPNPEDPIVANQVSAVLKQVEIDEDTIVVGHSLGGVVALKLIERLDRPVRKLVLVASYLENEFLNNEPFADYACDWKFDYEKIRKNIGEISILRDTTDTIVPPGQATAIRSALGGRIFDFAATTPHAWGKKEPSVLQQCLDQVSVYTTRPDTLFGATYLVLAPEHGLVDRITTTNQRRAVEQYRREITTKSDLERTSLEKEKTGVFTGAFATNPVNNEKIPIWIADYVLLSYGTGAIMAVPAHDTRDLEFARKYHLPINEVIQPTASIGEEEDGPPKDADPHGWTGEGTLVNSAKFNGLDSRIARQKIVSMLRRKGSGKPAVNYKLRDWVFSRQRYWGEPIPLVHCEQDGVVPVPASELPVLLPEIEKYEPTGTEESPLAANKEWVNTTCPKCGGPAKRETNTMPQWAGSCWYYLRFCDPQNESDFASPKSLRTWLPVDLYVGGAEHAVLHLLYARFWHMVLYDIGAIPKKNAQGESLAEPFRRLKNQGLILGPDGEKMSKSRGNVINPDEIIDQYGADTLRMYEMFMGPFEDAKPWDTNGITGVRRFLDRVWNVADKLTDEPPHDRTHRYVKQIGDGIEQFRFNTCVSDLMKWVNEFSPTGVSQKEFSTFVCALSPFAPHLAAELWLKLGHQSTLAQEPWPKYDLRKIKEATVTIAVQVMGKLRATISVETGANQETVAAQAQADPNVAKHLAATPKKIIFVKDRLINFVV